MAKKVQTPAEKAIDKAAAADKVITDKAAAADKVITDKAAADAAAADDLDGDGPTASAEAPTSEAAAEATTAAAEATTAAEAPTSEATAKVEVEALTNAAKKAQEDAAAVIAKKEKTQKDRDAVVQKAAEAEKKAALASHEADKAKKAVEAQARGEVIEAGKSAEEVAAMVKAAQGEGDYVADITERNLFHVELDKPAYDAKSGKKLSKEFKQMMTIPEWKQFEKSMPGLGYEAKILWNPELYV